MSTYQINVRCTTCERFLNKDGMYLKRVWRCLCCKMPVRFTSYAGRKDLVKREKLLPSIHLNRV